MADLETRCDTVTTMTMSFTSELWRYSGDSAWHFVTLPKENADEVRDMADQQPRGFGSVRVSVTIGETTWSTSVFPDKKSGSYFLPVKKSVRSAEKIDEGVLVLVEVAVLG